MVADALRPSAQRGMALILALIVLVALMLAGLAMTRSVATTNMVAGNLAFNDATMLSTDEGVEAAITWLENNNGQTSTSTSTACSVSVGSTALACNQSSYGYIAQRSDPSSSQSWEDFWNATLASSALTLTADSAGNTVSYVIQRLCSGQGDASSTSIDCSISPFATAGTCQGGSSCSANATQLKSSGGSGINGSQVYYRITVRSSGPRNTKSLVQAIVAL